MMYYKYRSIWAILTYRVYQLYDKDFWYACRECGSTEKDPWAAQLASCSNVGGGGRHPNIVH